jgi:hypothetical protein
MVATSIRPSSSAPRMASGDRSMRVTSCISIPHGAPGPEPQVRSTTRRPGTRS